MSNILDHLKLVDVASLRFHEAHEPARLAKTARQIEADGVLKHPPVVVRLQNDQYLIVDGAHRCGALLQLHCRQIPVQVVAANDLQIDTWDHLVPNGDWLWRLQTCPELQWVPVEPEMEWRVVEAEGMQLADLWLDNARYWLYAACEKNDRSTRMQLWQRIVHSYSQSVEVQRVPGGTWTGGLAGQVLLRFPRVRFSDMEELVLAGELLPAGVTRCVIQGRLLNLRIPLQMLVGTTDQSAQWNELMQQWQNALRLYTEPVYLFEA